MKPRKLSGAAARATSLVVLTLAFLTAGCESRARDVVLCGSEISPYITDWDGSVWGLHDYAFMRIVTPDASSTKLVEEVCSVAKQPFVRAQYPARPAPRALPTWWSLQAGESVDYATLVRFDGDWVGFVYRRPVAEGAVEWLMFAGGN